MDEAQTRFTVVKKWGKQVFPNDLDLKVCLIAVDLSS